MTSSYKPTKRSWVKLWVDEWLSGTTRFELSEKQRSIWIDLLAMAGKSRFPGIIASGKYDDGYRGYPLNYLAGTLVYSEDEFLAAIEACVVYGKITVDKNDRDGTTDYVIHINNWTKYQSEYQRQKQYTGTDLKEDDIAEEVSEIFRHWNEQKIVVHDQVSKEMIRHINKSLQSHSIDTIKTSISNYAVILHGKEYFWEYTWRLEEFLARGVDRFSDLEIAKKNFLIKQNSGKRMRANDKGDPNSHAGLEVI